jgi:glycosyltransferase involved in cell wall biosynthesis
VKVVFITRESRKMPAVRVRCYGFAKHLRQAGIETEVFSFADELDAKIGIREQDMTFFEKIGYNIKAYKRLKKKNAVFVLQRCNYHSLSAFFLKSLNNKKLIFDLDDWEAREQQEYFFGFIPRSKAYPAMEFLAKQSFLCIAASSFLEQFLKQYNQNTVFIPTGVDTQVFRPQSVQPKKKKTVFSWAGTVYRKDNLENLKFLIDCFKTAFKTNEDVSLEIIGEGAYTDRLRTYIADSGCKNIELKDWINPEHMPEYIQKIDIGLMPLIQESKFNQAKSPTRMYEYMAMEKPFLASNYAQAKEVIIDGYNGMLAKDKNEFVQKMHLLAGDPSLRERLGKNARKTVAEKYSLEKLTQELIEKIKDHENNNC